MVPSMFPNILIELESNLEPKNVLSVVIMHRIRSFLIAYSFHIVFWLYCDHDLQISISIDSID